MIGPPLNADINWAITTVINKENATGGPGTRIIATGVNRTTRRCVHTDIDIKFHFHEAGQKELQLDSGLDQDARFAAQ